MDGPWAGDDGSAEVEPGGNGGAGGATRALAEARPAVRPDSSPSAAGAPRNDGLPAGDSPSGEPADGLLKGELPKDGLLEVGVPEVGLPAGGVP
ncbi:hypothetical protein [Actinoplanes sp. NPDC051859]|uniref:hypothetical protein n=1 Tax=Actinoplanes sp. NPDC051859 TaxID=3363909 RepID=UPI00378F9093